MRSRPQPRPQPRPRPAPPQPQRRRPLATTAAALSAPVVGLLALAGLGAVAGGGPELGSLPGVDGLVGSTPDALVKDEPKRKREKAEDDFREPKPAKETKSTKAKDDPEPLDGSPGFKQRRKTNTPTALPPPPPPPEEAPEEPPPPGSSGNPGQGGSG